ncbi:MAG: RNA methyltransferase [Firmicutes bacterium]|nr:RNA methyltransferase [Bacillota bacterium]
MIEQRGSVTSRHNPLVKYVRSLAQKKNRELTGCFVVEGIRLLEEAARASSRSGVFRIELLMYSTDAAVGERIGALIRELAGRGVETVAVTPAVMEYLSDTTSPSGILGVVRRQETAGADEKPGPDSFILILDAVQDPGNLGTLLRTAEAAGVSEVWTTPGTVDVLSPKVIRATMGSIFRVPVRTDVEPAQINRLLPGEARVYGAAGGRGTPYHRADYASPLAVVLGGEANGLSRRMEKEITDWVHIPMAGSVDSLNVAVAGALVLFEVARRHRLLEHDFRDVL